MLKDNYKMGRRHDFVVESNDLCFICLNRNIILPQTLDNKGLPNLSTHSLQSLSRFLKIDMKTVFNKQCDIDPDLLNKVTQSTLNAKLCNECSNLMQKFSQLNQQLEKIRMEMMSSLININEQFIQSNEEDISEEVNKIPDGWSDKLNILKNLRLQAIEKSSRLIISSAPRIKVEILAMDDISLKKLKLKQMSNEDVKAQQSTSYKSNHVADTHVIQIGNVKNEYLIESSTFENQDDNNISYGDDHSSSELNEEEEPVVAEIKVDVRQPKIAQCKAKLPVQQGRASSNKRTPRTANISTFSPIKVNGKYRCNICMMLYKTRGAASQHHARVHLKVRYTCEICDKVFVKREAYNGHYRAVHLGDAGLTCNKCKRSFAAKQNLERHQLMRTCAAPRFLKSHICRFCGNGYSRLDTLNGHVKIVHLKSSGHTCNHCKKLFTSSSKLKVHIEMVHKRLREHRCNICAKAFSSNSTLKYHKFTAHGLPRPGSLGTS